MPINLETKCTCAIVESANSSSLGCPIATKKLTLEEEFKTTADELYATFTDREVCI
jgi:activator of HSP90 ATPase